MVYLFSEEFEVRDYECDIQGIVNNANYQHYMEHARHCLIKSVGLDFKNLHDNGIDVVVSKIEIAYKKSLTSGDRFVCRTNVKKEGIRYVFYQDIYRMSDNALCTKGRVETVALVDGKLGVSEVIEQTLFDGKLLTE